MKKVKILLSGKTKLQYYVDAVKKAGAEPKAEYLPQINTDCNGLILCGGSDINPKYYGEELCGSVNIDVARDEVEFALLKAYIDEGKPVLGICRGYQLINVFFGGSLYQHLPETDLHTNKQELDITHSVTAAKNSLLYNMYGSSFAVNSAHHQAIKKVGKDLCATAYWNDKYIEAFEHSYLPILGVQWHPERMCVGQRRNDTVDGIKIFNHFVDICRNNF